MIIDKCIGSSKTLQFSFKAKELKQQGKEIISLGLGEPEYDTPEHIRIASKEALDAGYTRYSAAQGLMELRELIAEKLYKDNKIDAKPSELTIVSGAKNALFIACASLLHPEDEIINLTPCYVSNVPILKLAEPQCLIHNAPLIPETFELDKNFIKSLINKKTKLIFINYPNNPTGKMISEDEAEFLRDMVYDNDIYLLSDEIYEKVVFSDQNHISFASFDKIKDKVITVNGFSKAYAMTGWRIGYVHANKKITSPIIKIHQQLNTNTPAFIQKAAMAALTGPQDHIDHYNEKLRRRTGLYKKFLYGNRYLSGLIPQAGFFAFLNISSTKMTSDEFCTNLLEETGVATIPGMSFGDDFDGYCRISLVNHTEIFKKGLNLISDFVYRKVEEK